MTTFLSILMIAVITVIIIDLSGLIDELEEMISKIFKVKKDRVHIPKPFSCSFCMSHHISLIYLIVIGEISLFWYMTILMISFITPFIYAVLLSARDILMIIPNSIDSITKALQRKKDI